MSFDPNSVINQATTGNSIYSPLTGNSNLSYQGQNFYGMNPTMGAQGGGGSTNSGGGFNGISQYLPSPSNFTRFNPASQNPSSSPLSHLNSPFSGITTSIDNFGANYLGFGGASTGTSAGAETLFQGFGAGAESVSTGFGAEGVASGFGPAGAAIDGATGTGSLTAASLSGTLGAAGLGFAGGGMLAGALGMHETGGSIGGGIGAGIGFMVGGPIGAIIGGIGGSLFGGMFGPGTPTNADFYSGNLSADGSAISKVGGGSKNPGQWSGYGQATFTDFQTLAKDASQALGIQYNPDVSISSGISTEHGGSRIKVGDQVFKYKASDITSLQGAQGAALQALAKQSGYTDMPALTEFLKNYKPPKKDGSTAPNIAPAATPQGPSEFDRFLANFKAQQNANAEQPTP